MEEKKVLEKIILEYYKEIYLEENKQRFLGLISDYFEKNRDFAQILKQIISTNILQNLYEADSQGVSDKIDAIKYAIVEIFLFACFCTSLIIL